jgi:hypothetical protein
LTSEQKHHLAEKELSSALRRKSQLAISTLCKWIRVYHLDDPTYTIVDVLENVLALLYNHFAFYLGTYATKLAEGQMTGMQSILNRSLVNYAHPDGGRVSLEPSSADLDKLRTDGSVVLSPILSKLKQIELNKEAVGPAANDRQAFIGFLASRLQDLCFLGGLDAKGF